MHLPMVRRWLLLALAFAMVGAQAFGVVHRSVHGAQPVHAHVADRQHADDAHEAHADGHGALHALFELGDDGLACQLLDQLGHGAAAALALLLLAFALPGYRLPWLPALAPGRPAVLPAPRGPPLPTR